MRDEQLVAQFHLVGIKWQLKVVHPMMSFSAVEWMDGWMNG